MRWNHQLQQINHWNPTICGWSSPMAAIFSLCHFDCDQPWANLRRFEICKSKETPPWYWEKYTSLITFSPICSHGSWKWLKPRAVSFTIGPCSTEPWLCEEGKNGLPFPKDGTGWARLSSHQGMMFFPPLILGSHTIWTHVYPCDTNLNKIE